MIDNRIEPIYELKELALGYFNDNENAVKYELSKALFGSKLGVGVNKQGMICKALVGEYPFITDSKGFLIIDKQSFTTWLGLKRESQNITKSEEELYEEYKGIHEEIEQKKKTHEEHQRIMAENRKTRDQLVSQIAKMEEEMKGFPEQIKALEEKKAKVRAEADKLEAQRIKEAKEYLDEQKRVEDETKTREQNKMWLFRRPIIPSFEYDDSPARKLSKEILRFFIYGLIFHAIWYVLYFG